MTSPSTKTLEILHANSTTYKFLLAYQLSFIYELGSLYAVLPTKKPHTLCADMARMPYIDHMK